jgi:hypothetical protein
MTSAGEVEVRAFTAREMTQQKIISTLKLQEVDQRSRGMKPERIREAKADAMADVYYDTIARGIVAHKFTLGDKTLPQYLGALKPADADAIERAQTELNDPQEALGNSKPSSAGKQSKTQSAKTSSST